MEKINIAFTIDRSYIQHIGVLLCSLFVHNPLKSFQIYLIIDFEECGELKKLKRYVASWSHEIEVLILDKEKVKNLRLSHHATSAVYYRLLLPELLNNRLEKILYLDSDIIIKKDIQPLWSIELKQHPLAAVQEPLFDRHRLLNLKVGTPYFNSGVMLLNLPIWRKLKISERAIEFIKANPEKITFWDQDGLNAILKGNWLKLDYKWNLQSQLFDVPVHYIESSSVFKNALKDPAIIHYSSKFKPWHYWCDHPLRAEYYKYLSKTPWKSFKLTEKSRWNNVKQILKKTINRLAQKEVFKIYA